MGRFRDFVQANALVVLLRRMEAEATSDEYVSSEIYRTTERSRMLGRRALELAAVDETHDVEGVAELRALAGRHRKDLRRAAREIAGTLALTERRAFEMLMAASRGPGGQLETISDDDRTLYARLAELYDLPDASLLHELKVLEPRLDQIEQRFAATLTGTEEARDSEETLLALREAIQEFAGPRSSAADALLRTSEVEQLAVYAISTNLGIESPIDDRQLPLLEPFEDPPNL